MLLCKNDSREPLLAAIDAHMVAFVTLLPAIANHLGPYASVTSEGSCYT
jgi:hypothetical protein